jgi:hypothetical protein
MLGAIAIIGACVFFVGLIVGITFVLSTLQAIRDRAEVDGEDIVKMCRKVEDK